jgi:hypothetical protein
MIDSTKPAFPIVAANTVFAQGMSLRDWFAGQALPTLLDSEINNSQPHSDEKPWAVYAEMAYGIADAMLAERTKP